VATARELLEQADALMRRNRLREAAAAATDIPVLTDVVDGGVDAPRVPGAEALRETEAGGTGTVPLAPRGIAAPPSAAGGFPVLTEIVEDAAPISILGAPVLPAGGGDPEAARWTALAEEVKMQVLQRIDIFTDTGLQDQLAARLQPIVDRAGADLVATITQQVGQLLRGYVADAIEREIEKWRHDGAA
jgi:hypothetical protein